MAGVQFIEEVGSSSELSTGKEGKDRLFKEKY